MINSSKHSIIKNIVLLILLLLVLFQTIIILFIYDFTKDDNKTEIYSYNSEDGIHGIKFYEKGTPFLFADSVVDVYVLDYSQNKEELYFTLTLNNTNDWAEFQSLVIKPNSDGIIISFKKEEYSQYSNYKIFWSN